MAAWLVTYRGSFAEEASAPPSTDAREMQFEILTQAVTALCQEIARNNQRSQELSEESVRLRARVESLRRELANSESEDDRLRSRAEALEKQLREVGGALPETTAEPRRVDVKPDPIPASPKGAAAEPEAPPLASARARPEPAGDDGTYHVVAPGENLFRIGVAYGVDYRELASANHIDNPSLIEVGQRLLIPHHAPR